MDLVDEGSYATVPVTALQQQHGSRAHTTNKGVAIEPQITPFKRRHNMSGPANDSSRLYTLILHILRAF